MGAWIKGKDGKLVYTSPENERITKALYSMGFCRVNASLLLELKEPTIKSKTTFEVQSGLTKEIKKSYMWQFNTDKCNVDCFCEEDKTDELIELMNTPCHIPGESIAQKLEDLGFTVDYIFIEEDNPTKFEEKRIETFHKAVEVGVGPDGEIIGYSETENRKTVHSYNYRIQCGPFDIECSSDTDRRAELNELFNIQIN